MNEIIKNNKSIIKIIKEIYKECFKESYKTLKADFVRRVDKKYPVKQNIQQTISLFTKFSIAFFTPFLPKKILLYVLKKISDVNYKRLERFRVKNGRQRYNFFIEPNSIRNDLKFTNERYLKSKRPIENSLRSIVKENSAILATQFNEEDKILDKIAKMQ